jgi:alpha-L-rhamnosidase
LEKGATSLTKAWDAGRDSSQNHFMLGQIQEWFYHDLAGIQNARKRGLQKDRHQPAARRRRDVGEGQLQFHPGKIVSDWKRDGEKFTLKVSIPATRRRQYSFQSRSAFTTKMHSGCKTAVGKE